MGSPRSPPHARALWATPGGAAKRAHPPWCKCHSSPRPLLDVAQVRGQRHSTNAVLPLPTGPAMPMRKARANVADCRSAIVVSIPSIEKSQHTRTRNNVGPGAALPPVRRHPPSDQTEYLGVNRMFVLFSCGLWCGRLVRKNPRTAAAALSPFDARIDRGLRDKGKARRRRCQPVRAKHRAIHDRLWCGNPGMASPITLQAIKPPLTIISGLTPRRRASTRPNPPPCRVRWNRSGGPCRGCVVGLIVYLAT